MTTHDHAPQDSEAVADLRDAPARLRGRRPGGEVSGREALLRAALSDFSRYGFEGTSLRSLAASAGVDMALVARLFGSKADLWIAVVDHLAERQAADRAKLAALAKLALQRTRDPRLHHAGVRPPQ
jgi:AcrR family transcriptional regulator